MPLLALQLGNSQVLSVLNQPADQLFQGLVHSPGNSADAGRGLERFVAGPIMVSSPDVIDRMDWDSLNDALSWDSAVSRTLPDQPRRAAKPQATAADAQDAVIAVSDVDCYFAVAADGSFQTLDSD
jgi:hypothetical protein